MWNDVSVDQGRDAIHACSVVFLTAGGSKTEASNFYTVVLAHRVLQSPVVSMSYKDLRQCLLFT